MTFPAKTKAAWLEALRSGKYKQGQYKLRPTEDSFCCLGVLCDVVAPGEWKEFLVGYYKSKDQAFLAPVPTMRIEDTSYRQVITAYQENILAKMNDSGSSFSEIADWIEVNL